MALRCIQVYHSFVKHDTAGAGVDAQLVGSEGSNIVNELQTKVAGEEAKLDAQLAPLHLQESTARQALAQLTRTNQDKKQAIDKLEQELATLTRVDKRATETLHKWLWSRRMI